MKNKKFWSVEVLLIFAAISCVVLAVLLCIANPVYLFLALPLLAFLFLLAAFDIQHLRSSLRRLLGFKGAAGEANTGGLANIALPVAVLHGERIVWYNNAFKNTFAGGEDMPLAKMEKVIPKLNTRLCGGEKGQNIDAAGRRFTVYGGRVSSSGEMLVAMFVDNTELKKQAAEYIATRPAVLYIAIDTYDDFLKQMRESESAAILSAINSELESYFGKTSGFLRRISTSQYIAIVEERHMASIIEGRFEVLDAVRKIGGPNAIATLSIGVGHGGTTFRECEDMAQQALDMALGRGGDQAAVKGADGFSFYGGITRSIEKRTKVKSRMAANAIRNIVEQSTRVLIMGHKHSDMDSVGAAIGMLRFCKMAGKQATVVINQNTTLAGPLVEYLNNAGYGEDLMSPEVALPLAGPKTLLIVVDTHIKYLLESEAIYKACGHVVVVDHHRKMVDHIDNAVVFYHEPYASSASELVSELLQYNGENAYEKIRPEDAEALLAGIMLDTRTFSLHVGVRTFEAAAFLRKMGAQTATVKKMFSSSMHAYLSRSHLVSEAEISQNCAIVTSDELVEDAEVVVAQAANDLLTIEGIKASFVAVQQDGEVRVSARSMGELNVQVIMEKMGGGGHLTMAGAQIKNEPLTEVKQRIIEAIAQYYKENEQVKENV
ncbi:MAG: DHH family phosphoesterase [Oscillospiraceae bacterium]